MNNRLIRGSNISIAAAQLKSPEQRKAEQEARREAHLAERLKSQCEAHQRGCEKGLEMVAKLNRVRQQAGLEPMPKSRPGRSERRRNRRAS